MGTGAGFISTVGPDRGKALIMVDGTPVGLVDLYAPTQRAAQVVWTTSGLSPATSHTVKVIALGIHNLASTGARVDYDGMLLLQ